MEINAEAVVGAIAANPILGVIILLCLGATVVNGATDAPNAIATVVGTRAMRPGPAIIMAAACNFVGMVLITMVSAAVASTIFGMVDFGGDDDAALIALAAAMAAIIVWGAAAWAMGTVDTPDCPRTHAPARAKAHRNAVILFVNIK